MSKTKPLMRAAIGLALGLAATGLTAGEMKEKGSMMEAGQETGMMKEQGTDSGAMKSDAMMKDDKMMKEEDEKMTTEGKMNEEGTMSDGTAKPAMSGDRMNPNGKM